MRPAPRLRPRPDPRDGTMGRVQRLHRHLATAAAASVWLGEGLAYAPTAHAQPPTVAGTKDPARAPLLPVGDSLDTIGGSKNPETATRNYRVERPDLATQVFVGAAMTVPAIGSDGVNFVTEATDQCVRGPEAATGTSGRAVVANGPNATEGCPQQRSVVASLERFQLDSLTSADQDAAVLLRVVHVPPVTNAEQLPASLPRPVAPPALNTQDRTSVTPGTVITAPAEIQPGRAYQQTLTTGQPQFLAIDVDWGQALEVQVEVTVTPEMEEARSRGPELQVDVLGPTLNHVADTTLSLGSTTSRRRVFVTAPVVWRSYGKGGSTPFLAGRHLLVVGTPEKQFGKPVTFDYTVTTALLGEVRGVPQFATPAPAGGRSGPVKKYAALGLGVAGALMLVASGVLWARSRR